MKISILRRSRKLSALILVPCIVASLLCGCPDVSEENVEQIGNVKYGMPVVLSSKSEDQHALVYSIVWDGNPANTVFEIQDTFKDVKVTSIGGSALAFKAESDPNAKAQDKDSQGTSNPVILTLKLGKNINNIGAIARNETLSIDGVSYPVFYKVECSEDNPYYYSEDGKLYSRTGDKLIEGFRYPTADLKGLE